MDVAAHRRLAALLAELREIRRRDEGARGEAAAGTAAPAPAPSPPAPPARRLAALPGVLRPGGWGARRRLQRDAALVSRSGLFDAAWYLARYPDVAAAGADPVEHYLRHGARELRDPGPRFDTAAYLARHPDAATSGANPLVHLALAQEEALALAERIELPRHERPVASVVVPVHGEAAFTARCLASIAAHPARTPFEVIVVDDASPDATPRLLSRVRNLTAVANGENLGYLRSCNAGIARAAGRYVVLLNNDTEVTPGWLDALVDLAERDPAVGVVGAKLVFPDGRLQEAGGIVWSDGTGWNYGRGGDPDRHEYNVVREVDYCSGACLLARADLLRATGGYDERFAPAYYEDTDLCFAARAAGYRVLYQPLAVVVHHEGATHGTDVEAGVKRHQEPNRRTFREKWAAQLDRQPPSPGAALRRASDRRRGTGVLVVDHMVPTPDRDSGSLRMSLLVRALAGLGCRVWFLPENLHRAEPYTGRLGQLGVEVLYDPGDARKALRDIAGEIDLAVLSRPEVAARHLPLVRELAPRAAVAYDMVDFHGLRESRRGEVDAGDGAAEAARVYRALEMELVRAADLTIAITDDERDLVLAEVPGARVHVVPNIHDAPRSTAGFGARSGLLFVGSFLHPPNEDAVLFFHDAILPLVRRRLPEVVLHVVGQEPPERVRALASDRVLVHGWVEDIGGLHDRCRVLVAPLRFGAGMKGKIGDSLARGLPVVTTTVGAEGMGLADGSDVLVADDPAAFAEAVVRLHEDEALWTALADRGARHVAERFGPQAAARRVAALLDEVRGRGTHPPA